jgi:hypothetical protein
LVFYKGWKAKEKKNEGEKWRKKILGQVKIFRGKMNKRMEVRS